MNCLKGIEMEDKNPIEIYKTLKFIKEEKNKKYFPLNGMTTWLGAQR